ncbi:MAG: non-ribosomal peptide synthetase, partial [Planctomycetota bacterium]
ELPPLRIQYKDFSQWQNSEKEKESIKLQEAYWLEVFSGEIPVLNLPLDYPRPVVQRLEGSTVSFGLPRQQTEILKNLALNRGATLYMVLLAVVNVLMARLSDQEDIVIGTPVAGRRHADLEQIIGMFVNTLALRNQPEGSKTFEAFFREVKTNTLKAFENQDYPFEDLVDKVAVNRDAGRNPLFDVMFTLQNLEDAAKVTGMKPAQELSGETRWYEKNREAAKFDMSLTGVEIAEELSFHIQYSTSLFKPAAIERFIDYFKTIIDSLRSLLKNPGKKLLEIEMLTEREKQELLFDFNNTNVQWDEHKNKTIPRLFEEQVEKTPAHLAAVFKDEHLTYSQLNKQSNDSASILRDEGVLPEHIVGIMLERSLEMIIAILAVLKSGGAYLPLDPGYPLERIRYMLNDSKTKHLMTRKELTGNVEFGKDVILLEGIYNEKNAAVNVTGGSNPAAANGSHSLAYVIYTSGSTGVPKGVAVEHFSVINLAASQVETFDIDEKERILQFSSISFDASVEQVFIALFSGAVLVLIDKETLLDMRQFEGFILRHSVTHIHAVPSFLNNVDIRLEGSYPVKRVIAGGDICPVRLAEKYLGYCDFYNEYGPTETTVTSTEMLVNEENRMNPAETWNHLPIGKPLKNTTTYLFDRWMNPVPNGVVGELYIGGAGVSRGYLNLPQLTSEMFVPNPFVEGECVYRTGDLARRLPDPAARGAYIIEFLGRL